MSEFNIEAKNADGTWAVGDDGIPGHKYGLWKHIGGNRWDRWASGLDFNVALELAYNLSSNMVKPPPSKRK